MRGSYLLSDDRLGNGDGIDRCVMPQGRSTQILSETNEALFFLHG